MRAMATMPRIVPRMTDQTRIELEKAKRAALTDHVIEWVYARYGPTHLRKASTALTW